MTLSVATKPPVNMRTITGASQNRKGSRQDDDSSAATRPLLCLNGAGCWSFGVSKFAAKIWESSGFVSARFLLRACLWDWQTLGLYPNNDKIDPPKQPFEQLATDDVILAKGSEHFGTGIGGVKTHHVVRDLYSGARIAYLLSKRDVKSHAKNFRRSSQDSELKFLWL